MLIHEGSARTNKFDSRLAVSLAAIAGALNAAVFDAAGFFSGNMTGNVSALSDRIASGRPMAALGFLAIIISFIFGATISSLLINAGRRKKIAGIYAYSIMLEAMLLALLGIIDITLSGLWRNAVIIVGLSFLMGLQNAVVTRISNARVRTTHVSGMATDIGIEIGNLLDLIRGKAASDNEINSRSNLRLHIQTVASFLTGGIFGVILYHVIGGALFVGAATILFFIARSGISAAKAQVRTRLSSILLEK